MKDIYLNNKNLKTLEGLKIPKIVTGNFACRDNQLTSLEFGPKEVGEDCFCSNNLLTSLEFCANKIGYDLLANINFLTNLKGIHIHFKNGYINGGINLERNPLKSHLLGVILIPRLKNFYIDDRHAEHIIAGHFETRDVLECQEELIQNGFREFAQL